MYDLGIIFIFSGHGHQPETKTFFLARNGPRPIGIIFYTHPRARGCLTVPNAPELTFLKLKTRSIDPEGLDVVKPYIWPRRVEPHPKIHAFKPLNLPKTNFGNTLEQDFMTELTKKFDGANLQKATWNLKELTEGHHQEWSLWLNLTQHGKSHQARTLEGLTDW